MRNRQLQDPIHGTMLLSRISREPQKPSLLARMNLEQSQDPELQGLPLNQTQGSIKTYSSVVMPWSKDIERGRSQNRQRTPKSSRNSLEHLEMIDPDQMQPLDLSSQPLKVMTPRLEQQLKKEERCTWKSAPPALLYRIQMKGNLNLMENLSPSVSRSTSQHIHGSKTDKRSEPYCEILLPKRSDSSNSIQLTQKRRRDPSSRTGLSRIPRFGMEECHRWKISQP